MPYPDAVRADALVVAKYLKNDRQVGRLVLHGESIGGLSACHVARRLGLGQVDLLICDRTFASLDAVAARLLGWTTPTHTFTHTHTHTHTPTHTHTHTHTHTYLHTHTHTFSNTPCGLLIISFSLSITPPLTPPSIPLNTLSGAWAGYGIRFLTWWQTDVVADYLASPCHKVDAGCPTPYYIPYLA